MLLLFRRAFAHATIGVTMLRKYFLNKIILAFDKQMPDNGIVEMTFFVTELMTFSGIVFYCFL